MPSQHHLLRRAVPLALLGSLLIAASVSAAGPTTRRLSLDSAKVQGDGDSQEPAISADGRYVAFSSYAANLVGGDTNGVQDVFVRDRTTKTTTRLSVSSVGAQSDGESQEPAISADGRYVAFCSSAANLVGGDTNNSGDVFVRDRTTNTTTRLSVSSVGLQGDFGGCSPSISADGRYVAFESSATNLGAGRAVVSNSDTNNRPDVFVRDRTRNTTTRLSVSSAGLEGDDSSYNPAISADGRYVAFSSYATNLVGSDTNGTADVFVRDRTTNTTTRLSVSSAGLEGNVASFGAAISADGRYVAFDSYATNLVGSDTNGTRDVFVRDRLH